VIESVDWLHGLPATRQRPVLERVPELDPHRVTKLREQAQRRRQQGEIIKDLLRRSPAAGVIPKLLGEMENELGVQSNARSLEKPGYRLAWKVTFSDEAPSTTCYFLVRRLFSGQSLCSAGSDYLGPAWEAPDRWMDYTADEVTRLLSHEEVVVGSARGERRVEVAGTDWVARLQRALRTAYQRPFRQGWR